MLTTENNNHKKAEPASKTVKKVIRWETVVSEKSVTLRAEEPQVRYLRIHPLYRHLSDGITLVPELRLNGCWLELAGFSLAGYESITVMDGLLIIRSNGE